MNFSLAPDVILAFFAVRRRQFCKNERHGFSDSDAEQRLLGFDLRPREQGNLPGVVVERLFGMRNKPIGIDGVTGNAASEGVVDTTLGYLGEGEGLCSKGSRKRGLAGIWARRGGRQVVDRRR